MRGELNLIITEVFDKPVNLHARSEQDGVVMVIPAVDLKVDVSVGSKVNFIAQAQAHPSLR